MDWKFSGCEPHLWFVANHQVTVKNFWVQYEIKLWKGIQNLWTIDLKCMSQQLIDSMIEHVEKVIMVREGHIKY